MKQTEMAAHDKITWNLYSEACRQGAKVEAAAAVVKKAIAAEHSRSSWERRSFEKLPALREYLAEAQEGERKAAKALADHEVAYTGWKRFWCVPAGHIHSSRRCSTCNKMGKATSFYLAHEVSGMDEADAVAAQGPVLCTTCFPTAPLDWTNGLDEAAKAKKALQCAGSGKYLNDKLPKRTGYYSGNWATCETCGEHITITTTWKLRAHKAKG